MSEGIKLPVVIPWTMVAAAAVALIFMYRDVQTMKESMVKAERIAALETEVSNLKNDMGQNQSSHQALWQAIGRKADR